MKETAKKRNQHHQINHQKQTYFSTKLIIGPLIWGDSKNNPVGEKYGWKLYNTIYFSSRWRFREWENWTYDSIYRTMH